MPANEKALTMEYILVYSDAKNGTREALATNQTHDEVRVSVRVGAKFTVWVFSSTLLIEGPLQAPTLVCVPLKLLCQQQ